MSRTTYAALFSAIGTTYGAGDGSTTFELPNLIDKFVEGSSSAGTVKAAGLPNITGSFYINVPTSNGSNLNSQTVDATGSFEANHITTDSYGMSFASMTPKNKPSGVNIDASRSSSVYGNSTTVQPPALKERLTMIDRRGYAYYRMALDRKSVV